MILYKELGWSTYEPTPSGRALFDEIQERGKLSEFEEYLEESEGGFVDERIVDDLLRFQEKELRKALNMPVEDDDDQDFGKN